MSIQSAALNRILLALVVASALPACMTPSPGTDQGALHRGATAGAGQTGGGMMGAEQAGSGTTTRDEAAARQRMMPMDMESMCAMHRAMQSTASEQERQAMMDQRMGHMSPEMRQQHMEMMRQHCK